jgi:hypothetical protein
MRALLERLSNPLHLAIALLVIWLIFSSPWIGMYQRMPDPPGLMNLGHVVGGFAVLAMTLVYGLACTRGGRWRLYFPWLAGDRGAIGRDISGMFRGERPMSEGGGLFAAIEGLLLLAVLLAAVTGAAWFGHSTRLARNAHRRGARCGGADAPALCRCVSASAGFRARMRINPRLDRLIQSGAAARTLNNHE